MSKQNEITDSFQITALSLQQAEKFFTDSAIEFLTDLHRQFNKL
jgi:hypothetical protein